MAVAVRQLEAAVAALPAAGAVGTELPAALDALLNALPPGDADALAGMHAGHIPSTLMVAGRAVTCQHM